MSKNNGIDKKQQVLFSQGEINKMLESVPSNIHGYIDSLQNQISNMSAIGLALSKERDMDKLLEMILIEAKRISNADGGTLYMMTDDHRLRFSIMITDSLDVHMGGTSEKEIPFDEIYNSNTIGISSGASAPEKLVQTLLNNIKKDRKVSIEEVVVAEEKVIFKLPKNLN